MLLEACQVHEKVALEHSSKSTKYELEGSYGDPVHEHLMMKMMMMMMMTSLHSRGSLAVFKKEKCS